MGVGRGQLSRIISADNFYTTTGTLGTDNILSGTLANSDTIWTADLSALASGAGANPAGGWMSGSFVSGATFSKMTPAAGATAKVGIGLTTSENPSEAFHLNGRMRLEDVGAPAETINRLYNDGGKLYFGSSQLLSGAAGNSGEFIYNSSGDYQGDANFTNTGGGINLTAGSFKIYPNVGLSTLFLSGSLKVSGTSDFRPTGATHNSANFYSPIAAGSGAGSVEVQFHPDGASGNPSIVASGNQIGWGMLTNSVTPAPHKENMLFDYTSGSLWVGGGLKIDGDLYTVSSSGDQLKFKSADDKFQFVSGTTSFLTFEKHGTQATEIYSDVTDAYLRFKEPVQLRSNNSRPYIEFLSQSTAADIGKIREVSGDLHISGASDLILDANNIYLHEDATSRGSIKLTSTSLELESAAGAGIKLDSDNAVTIEHINGVSLTPSNTGDSGAAIFNWGGGAYRPGFVNFPFYGEGGTFPYLDHTVEINSSGTLYIGNYNETQYAASSSARAFEAGSPQLYISGTALVSGSVRLPSAATVTSSPGANYLWASGTNLYWDDTKVNSGNFYITGGSYSASTGNLTIEQTGASDVVIATPNTTSGSDYAIAAYVPSKPTWVSGNAGWTLSGANMTGDTLKLSGQIQDLTTANTHFAFGTSTHITAVGGGGTSAEFHNGAIGIIAQSSPPTVANLGGAGGMLWASGTYGAGSVLEEAKPYWVDVSGNTYDLTDSGSGGGGTIGGSITDNQVAFGASTANSIEGSDNLTFDGDGLGIGTTAVSETRQGEGLTISGTTIGGAYDSTNTTVTSLNVPLIGSGAYFLASIGNRDTNVGANRGTGHEPAYLTVGPTAGVSASGNFMAGGRAISLVLAGTYGYVDEDNPQGYGNFGSLLFHGSSGWTGGARRWLATNAWNSGGGGAMGLGFAQSDNAGVDPTVSGSTPSVVFSTDTNYGVTGKGGLLVGNTSHIGNGLITSVSTTNPQLTLAYNGSKYMSTQIDSNGSTTFTNQKSYRFIGEQTDGTFQIDQNSIALNRDTDSAASALLKLGDHTTYDQFSILEDQRGSTATNGLLYLRSKKTGNAGYATVALGAISGSNTSYLYVNGISTNEAFRFDTNSKSHALDIAKAGYVSIGAAVSTTDALYVDGNTTINGVLTATAKSFDIPHPDKKGKRLIHGSLEGPEHGVYVRGTAKGHGDTTIELPDYWKTLVGNNYTLQLTSYNSSNVYIIDKDETTFTVGSNSLNYKFDYFVIGKREEIEVEIDGN